jgi:alpha-amylase
MNFTRKCIYLKKKGGGGEILTFFSSRYYKLANAFMLAWPYGFPQVMSSYNFVKANDWQGPPTNGGGDTKDVLINAGTALFIFFAVFFCIFI